MMARLEVIHMTGEVDEWPLSRQQPLTIGSHASTDITIDEDDVEIIHCRISWSKQGFEAVSAGTQPLEINGNLVKKSQLKSGDLLRIGTVDIRFQDSEEAQAAEAETENNETKQQTDRRPASESAASRKAKSAVDDIRDEDLIDDDEILDEDLDILDEDEPDIPGGLAAGLEALAAESRSPGKSRSSKKSGKSSGSKQKAPKEVKPRVAKPAAETAAASSTPGASSTESTALESATSREDDFSPRLREAMRHRQQRRPGEEDPLRSPLILGLTGGAAALILAGAIFYFMAFRQTTQQRFDQAEAVYNEGKFQNAINEFNNFVIAHPRTELAKQAKRYIGLAKIRQQIEGATPNFPEGLDQLRAFIREHSDKDQFESLHSEIVTHSRKIAVEAAQTAGKRFDSSLLQVSREARTILNTYAPKDAPPTETLNLIETELRNSEALILKNSVYLEHVARMEEALKGDDPLKTEPMEALKARRDLLVRYPRTSPTDRTSFENDRKVVELFNKALSLERQKVTPGEPTAEPLTDDRELPVQPLTLAFHGRTRIDEVSVGRSVIAVIKDVCYGVDFVTGEPVWRRTIGFDSPFFPLQESQLPSVILFDTNYLELVRLHQTTGQLIWRLPIGDFVRGAPLLADNTLYVSTESGRLLAVDLGTGLLASELNFSQPISPPVALKDDQYMLVVGNEEVCYTISKRPLECVQTSYLGHQPASVEAPLLSMGPYVLMIENKTRSATMRLLNLADPKAPATQAATAEVGNRVIDTPVIRGRDLFVPAVGEMIYAFSVSDDPGQPPLTSGPIYEGQGKRGKSINLLTGPNGQVWMATDALNKLQLTTDSLQPDGAPTAPGIATQPLQMVSGYLLNARRRPFTDAVTYTRTSRDETSSDWQVVLGGRLLAVTAQTGSTFNLSAINEAGHVFRVTERQRSGVPFVTNATVRLPLNAELNDPLLGAEVSGNRLAVACGLPEPRLWVLNAAGQIDASPVLPEPLQAPPCSIGNRVLLPLAGRLQVARLSGEPPVQEFVLPTGETHEWRSVTPAGEDQVVAVTKQGVVILIKLQTSGRANLAEVARINLGAEVVVNAASNGQWIAVADASRKVTLFDTVRLDPIASRTFDQPATSAPRLFEGGVAIEVGRSTLHVLKPTDLSDAFTVSLNSISLAGLASLGDKLVLAQQNGVIRIVSAESGEVLGTLELQAILDHLLQFNGVVYAVSVDGTLFAIET